MQNLTLLITFLPITIIEYEIFFQARRHCMLLYHKCIYGLSYGLLSMVIFLCKTGNIYVGDHKILINSISQI